ncbi:hypothetical protein DXG03_003585, partial [Asterophora parasitica]
ANALELVRRIFDDQQLDKEGNRVGGYGKRNLFENDASLGTFHSPPLQLLVDAIRGAFREWIRFFDPPKANATSVMRNLLAMAAENPPTSTSLNRPASTSGFVLNSFDGLDSMFSTVLTSTTMTWPQDETPADCIPGFRKIEVAAEQNLKRVRSSQLFDSEGEPKSKKSKSIPSTRASLSAAAGPFSSGLRRSGRIAGGSKKTT